MFAQIACATLMISSQAEIRPPKMAAMPFPLTAVRLLESPFRMAQEADRKYILSLDPDRLLHRFRKFAGLNPKGDEYGGWEKDTISGHSLGHYLSACALMYASTGDPKLKEKADYIVSELAACQEKDGTGYVGGLPDHERLWSEIEKGEIRSRGFDLNGLWVPWYNLHKTFAGLLDANRYCESKEALDVARKLADWSIHITRNLDDEKWQRMLACEHGGMNESLAELYSRTGHAKYLELARKFYHRAILDPLSEGKDILPGKHGNTNIPKAIGCARLFEVAGEAKDRKIAEFFWDRVVNHHSYAIGGCTSGEYFGPPDQLADRLTGNTCETCKTYNMVKFTWQLFGWNPDSKKADFAERALYNHILASQNPETGMMCYFVPLMPGSKKSFSRPTTTFTCCVGSGMENHARYGEGIYFHSDDSLWVNLYMPSRLDWSERGFVLKQTSPEIGKVLFEIEEATDRPTTLRLRAPGWSGDQRITLNESNVKSERGEDGYLAITRKWKKGDKVVVETDWKIRTEPTPDNKNRLAIFYGPYVLAADLSQLEKPWEPGRMPVLIERGNVVSTEIKSTGSLAFTTQNTGRPGDYALRPFYQITSQPYSVYFDVFSEAEWQKEEARYRADEQARIELEQRTIDYFAIGQMQPERDHKLTGDKAYAGDFGGRHWRDARNGGFFEFEMKVDPAADQEIIFTYWGGDSGRTFDILFDGQKLMTQRLQNASPGRFFDVVVPLPRELTSGKEKAKIRFQAPSQGIAGGLFGCRVARRKPV